MATGRVIMVIPAIINIIRGLREVVARARLRRILRNRLVFIVLFFALMWALSAALFYYAEHIRNGRNIDFASCLYWSLITMSTVGYGDIVPESSLGRLVAGITAVLGIIAYTLTISVIANEFLEKTMRKAMGLAPLKKKNIVVIGDDEACWDLVDELVANGLGNSVGWFMAKQPASEPPIDFFVGDYTRIDDMRKAGVDKASHIILCLRDDSKVLHIVLLIKKLNPRSRLHAIVKSSELADLLHEVGVSTVLPTRILGRVAASAVFEPSVVKFIEEAISIKGVADVTEIDARNLEGMTIGDAQSKLTASDKNYRYQILGIVRDEGLILAPSLEERIEVNERLLVLRVKKDSGLVPLVS